MKSLTVLLLTASAVMMSAQTTQAAMVWANAVEDYSANIQNFGTRGASNGILMDDSTEFWVLGEPDAAVNTAGNGLEPDHVAGWRNDAPGGFIVVSFNVGLADIAGDDLTIRMFSGPFAGANVLASVDGLDFLTIGTIGAGTPLEFRNEVFDFAGLFSDPIRFVRVERVVDGEMTGMFFDAFGGNAAAVVPEPHPVLMHMTALIFLGLALARTRGRHWA